MSDPFLAELVVDYLPPAVWPGPGRLGMTSAPGRRFAGGRSRDLARDLGTLREQGVALLVSLLPPYELASLGIERIAEAAAAASIELVALPIRDGQVPHASADVERVVEQVQRTCAAGAGAVVHCRAGMGRTGTVVACCLVAVAGLAAEAAIAEVRRARPGTVETGMQEAWIRGFARLRKR